MSTPFSVLYKTEHAGVVYHETSYGFVTYLPDTKAGTLSVLELYVHPNHRGQGLGLTLMEHAKEAAKRAGLTNFTTHIDPSDKSADSLRSIFKKTGLQKQDKNVTLEFELYSQEIS